jgi:hypothetical protein
MNKQIKGLEQWLYLMKRFNLDPKEALSTMDKHNQNLEEVLVYLQEILNSYTLSPMDREKLGKVKDLIDDKEEV